MEYMHLAFGVGMSSACEAAAQSRPAMSMSGLPAATISRPKNPPPAGGYLFDSALRRGAALFRTKGEKPGPTPFARAGVGGDEERRLELADDAVPAAGPDLVARLGAELGGARRGGGE